MKHLLPKKITAAGFNAYVVSDPASKLVYACAVIRGGFYNEFSDNEAGINHLFEHILTEAWKRCAPSRNRKMNCQQYWSERPAHYNARTTSHTVAYYITGLDTERDEILNYISQIISDPHFDLKIIENEKKAVLNELTMMQNNPVHALSHAIFSHVVSEESGLRNKTNIQLQIDNLKRITPEQIMQYHKRFYNSNNVTFFFSGNVTSGQITAVLSRNLGTMSRRHHNEPEIALVNSDKVTNPAFEPFGKNGTYKRSDFPIFIKNAAAKNTEFIICIPARQDRETKDIILKRNHFYLCTDIAQTELGELLRKKHELVYSISVQSYVSARSNYVFLNGSCQDADVMRVITLCLQYFTTRCTQSAPDKMISAAKGRIELSEYNTIRTAADLMQFYEGFFVFFLQIWGDVPVDKLVIPFEPPEKTLKHFTNATQADIMNQFKGFDISRAVYGYIGKRKHKK
jgi:secreted Zn-dependent insulinase-like peptidase